jgi:hypothetical protein
MEFGPSFHRSGRHVKVVVLVGQIEIPGEGLEFNVLVGWRRKLGIV